MWILLRKLCLAVHEFKNPAMHSLSKFPQHQTLRDLNRVELEIAGQ